MALGHLSHHSAWSQPCPVREEENIFPFLVWCADPGSGLRTGCEFQLAVSCCLPACELQNSSLHPLNHGHSSETHLVSFERDILLRYHATQNHHSENNSHICISFTFLPHLSTLAPFPHVPRGHRRTVTHYVSKTVHDFGKLKAYLLNSDTQNHYVVRNYPLGGPLSCCYKEREINADKPEKKCSY